MAGHPVFYRVRDWLRLVSGFCLVLGVAAVGAGVVIKPRQGIGFVVLVGLGALLLTVVLLPQLRTGTAAAAELLAAAPEAASGAAPRSGATTRPGVLPAGPAVVAVGLVVLLAALAALVRLGSGPAPGAMLALGGVVALVQHGRLRAFEEQARVQVLRSRGRAGQVAVAGYASNL